MSVGAIGDRNVGLRSDTSAHAHTHTLGQVAQTLAHALASAYPEPLLLHGNDVGRFVDDAASFLDCWPQACDVPQRDNARLQVKGGRQGGRVGWREGGREGE